jgi:hypothetical protein
MHDRRSGRYRGIPEPVIRLTLSNGRPACALPLAIRCGPAKAPQMNDLLVRNQITDFDQWKRVLDLPGAGRAAADQHQVCVFAAAAVIGVRNRTSAAWLGG